MSKANNHSLIAFPDDFTVIDIETTGHSPIYNEIIELSAIRVRSGSVAATYSTLVMPAHPVDSFITSLTGITNEMLNDAPPVSSALPAFLDFIGSDIIVGHNVSFDIGFIREYGGNANCDNDYVDTLRISRRALPELPHHRLQDLAEHFNIDVTGAHRSMADSQTTLACFVALKDYIDRREGLDAFIASANNTSHRQFYQKIDLRNTKTSNTQFDESHPLFGKHCVFTGTLEQMTRQDAAQAVVDLGGICDNGVTKKTNFLILGNNDYCSAIKDGKSSKHKKAEAYKLAGYDIEIIPESVFYDMLSDDE